MSRPRPNAGGRSFARETSRSSDGVDGPLAASRCQIAGGQRPRANREPSMGEITTVGLDLAKNVFQVHGVDAEGMTVLRKQLRRARVGVLKPIAALSGWAGSVRDIALLGA